MRFVKYRYGRRNVLFKTVCVLLVITISALIIDAKLRPAIIDFAFLEARSAAETTVAEAVGKILSDDETDYSRIVTVNYSDENRITGITTDIVKMNLFKSEIAEAVDKAFEKNDTITVSVPVGAASGLALLSGFGPDIKLKLSMSGATLSEFENVFVSAGVNQTQHSVMLHLKTSVVSVLSGRRVTFDVNTSFCVAQTVIVGSVPEVTVNK